jgi:hypothetical protein
MSTKKIINKIGIFLIFLFIIITVYTSLYAAGYRLNWHWPLDFNQLLSKTGMLIVQTSPRNVNIYLEKDTGGLFTQKEIKNNFQTPAKIQNLLPGKYKLSLEKSGYWPITRNIQIFPNQTTSLLNIFLFKRSLPLNIYKTEKESIIINEERDKIIFLETSKYLNLNNEEITHLDQDHVSLYLNNNLLLNNYDIYSLNDQEIIFNLQDIINENYLHIYMDLKNKKFFYNTLEKIAYINLNNNQEKILIESDNNILDFLIKNQQILSLEENNNNYYLISYDKTTLLRQKSISLPRGDYSFYFRDDNFLNLYDDLNKRLILFFNNQQKIIDQVDTWQWFDNNLLWQSNHELYRYNLLNNETSLLLRSSKNILNFIWQTNDNYLIYSSDSSIYILYFKEKRDDLIEILRAQNIGPLFINNHQNILYFYAEIDNQSGVFKLEIH